MPVNITEEFVHQLMGQIDFLTKQNSTLTATVDSMNQTINGLNQTIKELKEQLNKNSKNSSKPPSSDGLKKPVAKKNRSLRESSGKKQGAQEGHEGVHLSVISNPDHIREHMHSDCTGCPLHGGVKTGSFPENIKAAVQYGKNLRCSFQHCWCRQHQSYA